MEAKTVLVLGHLAGLVLGLGGVVVLDLYLLRFLRGKVVTPEDRDLVHLVSRLVSLGLVLLWASGAGFLAHQSAVSPHLLADPKVHAKLAIVALLTANGVVLHARVLPLFARNLGRGLFAGVPFAGRAATLTCGAVSATGWYAAFALGAVRELNFAASIWVFLGAYAAALGLVVAAALGMAAWLGAAPPRSASMAAERGSRGAGWILRAAGTGAARRLRA